MRPGMVGSVLVLLAGGAVGGAVYLKARAKLKRARLAREEGSRLLGQGDIGGARAEFQKAALAASQVGGLTGRRAEALEIAETARRELWVMDALERHKDRPLAALRVLGAVGDPPPGGDEALRVVRADLFLNTALALEGRESVDQAIPAFRAAAEATRAIGSSRHEEALQGQLRLELVTRLRDAERAIRNLSVERAAELARAARETLDHPGSPFGKEEKAKVDALQRRIEAVLVEVESHRLLKTCEERVDALYEQVGTNALGTLLSAVEKLEVPALPRGHRREELHAQRLEAARRRLALVRDRAREFAGMVLVRRTERGGVFLQRTEVSNAQFARFVKVGYDLENPNPAYWSREGMRRLKDLRFRDQTQKPGPALWREGAPLPGEEDHPVRGISYLEAEAYARWKGMRLPTPAEWRDAVGREAYPWGSSPWKEQRANLKGAGLGGPRPVNAYEAGKGPSGALNLIGNVQEIVAEGGEYFRIGGSFNSDPDPAELKEPKTLDFRRRGHDIGFRCAKELIWKDG